MDGERPEIDIYLFWGSLLQNCDKLRKELRRRVWDSESTGNGKWRRLSGDVQLWRSNVPESQIQMEHLIRIPSYWGTVYYSMHFSFTVCNKIMSKQLFLLFSSFFWPRQDSSLQIFGTDWSTGSKGTELGLSLHRVGLTDCGIMVWPLSLTCTWIAELFRGI